MKTTFDQLRDTQPQFFSAAAIAIPAAAEKAIQFSFAERTNCVQRFFKSVGRMREIDENFRARVRQRLRHR